ncbi:MIT domain-containing protein 1-like protein [Aphelenchoides avenae]|nr:MIT domain-containing protein 1-like protein [Aphelenchus avenae]
MSDPGREKPGEVPSSTAQRPTESPGGGKDEDGRSERAQNQRRHAPEVYAALQQLLFEGQLRLVLADDSPIPDDHDPETGLPDGIIAGIQSVIMLRRLKDTGPDSGSDDDSDYFDPNDESWLDDLDPSERPAADHRDFYVLDGEDEKKKPGAAQKSDVEEPPTKPEPSVPPVAREAEAKEATTTTKPGMRRIENAIILKEGAEGITYDDIFQECCNDSVKTVVMYDSYVIHGDYQMENFRTFCNMLKGRCPNLEKIELHTKRPDDAAQVPAANTISPSDKRRNFLDDLRRHCAITLDVKEYDHNRAPLHGRYIRFLDEQNDGWQVLADRGLDIFNRPVLGRGGGGPREKVITCRNTHFEMFRPGTDVLFPPESLANQCPARPKEASKTVSLTSMLASIRLSPGGRSSGFFAKTAKQTE